MPPCPDMGQSLASPNMKQLLLICAVVALVGCGKKDDPNTGVVNPDETSPKAIPEKLIDDPVEKAIREELNMPTGELTEADLEKVTELILSGNQLTSVKGLEKLTQLKRLYLEHNKLTSVTGLENLTKLETLHLQNNKLTDGKGLEKLGQLKDLDFENNPDLTKVQIDELQKALPKCSISHDFE